MNRRHARPTDAEVASQLADDAPVRTKVWYLTILAGVVLAVVGFAVDVVFGDAATEDLGFKYIVLMLLLYLAGLATITARGVARVERQQDDLERRLR